MAEGMSMRQLAVLALAHAAVNVLVRKGLVTKEELTAEVRDRQKPGPWAVAPSDAAWKEAIKLAEMAGDMRA